MVSRRIFFSICLMMAIILFMFQFLLVIRDVRNNYSLNEHLGETALPKSSAWSPGRSQNISDGILTKGEEPECVVYIGKSTKAHYKIIGQWCEYTKRRALIFDSLNDYMENAEDKPFLLCVSGSDIRTGSDVEILKSLALEGQRIVFCDLPPASVVAGLSDLRDLLGIQRIKAEKVDLKGIKMFSGFLLGGEVIYEAVTEKEQKMQDLELSVPWYLTQRATKTYMVGLLDDETVKNEELPGLIWRRSYANTQIFAINGPYMSDQTGIGILDAIAYESMPYEIHPVINAQNICVANYPDFAEENTEEMQRIYARNLRRLQMDLIWPNLLAAMNKGDYKMTCFMSPQLDYATDEAIDGSDVVFYLKQLKEQDAEAGLSLDYLPGIGLNEKMQKDKSFYDDFGSRYRYSTAYIKSSDKELLNDRAVKNIFGNLRSVTGVRENTEALISYATDNIVDQGITADGFRHTYSQDLKLRALETALGYSNILLDMRKVVWPEDENYWEVLYEAFSSNINTYWNAFSSFEKTTLSKSDQRVRSFLATDYTDTRKGNTIEVNISKKSEDCWFILRTHSESLRSVEGGTFKKIEKDAYLICAKDDTLKIEVEPDKKMKYKLN